jgi:hypothetical protein
MMDQQPHADQVQAASTDAREQNRRDYAPPHVTVLGDFRSITRMPQKGHSSNDGTGAITKNPA